MRCLPALLGCLLTCNAYADRIPDYSLSPEESMRQPSITHNSTQPLDPNGTFSNAKRAMVPDYVAPTNEAPAPSSHFMDGYCDKNFAPAIAKDTHYAAIASCLHKQREQACSQFQQLPDDAKRTLDQTIDCTNKLLNGENPDEQSSTGIQPNCSDTDTIRLQLMKKYWRDPNTAYALLFLPDEIMDNSSKCLRGGL